jgi:hypothetical protein
MPEPGQPRHLNHIEMVHAPGERHLAIRVFELLGGRISVSAAGTPIALDVASQLVGRFPHDNAIYVSEITPEQWEFEQSLRDTLHRDGRLRSLHESYVANVRDQPQKSFHFGIRFESLEALEERVEAINEAGADTELKGRMAVSGVYRPGTYTTSMTQAFVWTDVVASGLLLTGQHIELQWRLPMPALEEAPQVV